MWLGEQITSRGLGNGISLLIFAGIIAELPAALFGTLQLGRQGALSGALIIGFRYFGSNYPYICRFYGKSPKTLNCSIP